MNGVTDHDCRTYTGPRTNNIIEELPPEDPEDILSDYDIMA